ncbi:MAG: cell division protein FtsZ [Arcanobacterium sp.]|nr:cell division protein FtsZ [Arcanobacterium sp.]MDY5588620.1 cell division protein FtsZ [Arcanobacterium sp.]
MDSLNNAANIKVVGVGGGGVNAIDRMIQDGLAGVDFIAVNTDAQSLAKSEAETKIDIGRNVSEGLGAGADPSVGKRAAEENIDLVREMLQGSDMVFVTAGEGGGTGTGAAPVVAQVARDLGALTVGVVTRPFGFEGLQRTRNANSGISELRDAVDTLIVIPNDRLLELTENDIGIIEAFRLADQVLQSGVKGISDLITKPGHINLDFADVKTIMKDAGTALMGLGSATGSDRSLRATENAISSPLLEARIDGAHGVLLAFTASTDLGLKEYAEASQLVKEQVDPNANIIIGITLDESLGDEVRVTVIAAGFDESDDYLVQAAAPAQPKASEQSAAEPRVAELPAHLEEPEAQPASSSHGPRIVQEAAPTPQTAPMPSAPAGLDEADHKRPDLDIPPFLFGEE